KPVNIIGIANLAEIDEHTTFSRVNQLVVESEPLSKKRNPFLILAKKIHEEIDPYAVDVHYFKGVHSASEFKRAADMGLRAYAQMGDSLVIPTKPVKIPGKNKLIDRLGRRI